jgi:hypothetical protein
VAVFAERNVDILTDSIYLEVELCHLDALRLEAVFLLNSSQLQLPSPLYGATLEGRLSRRELNGCDGMGVRLRYEEWIPTSLKNVAVTVSLWVALG